MPFDELIRELKEAIEAYEKKQLSESVVKYLIRESIARFNKALYTE